MKIKLYFLLLPIFVHAQTSLVVTYQSTTSIPNLGEKSSTYKLYVDNGESYFVYQGKNPGSSENKTSSKQFSIIKDLKARKIYQASRWGTIVDSLNLIHWKLDKFQKVVLGYSCKKATCNFRGRNYEAFYAEQIPISNGPFKFGGLPGLILEISSTDKFIRYEAVNIEKAKFTTFQFPSHWLKKTLSFKTMLQMEEMADVEEAKKRESRLPLEQQGLIKTTISRERIESVP